LTGRAPFAARSFSELVIKISTTRPIPPRVVRGDIPRALDTLIQKAMAKERDDRVPSLDVLISELERFATVDQFPSRATAEHAPAPSVVSSSDRSLSEPALLSEQADTAADVAMRASLTPVEIPRNKEGKIWLIGAATLVVVLGAWMLLGSPNESTHAREARKVAVQPVTPSATAKAEQPSAAAPSAPTDSTASSQTEVPAVHDAPPSAAPDPERAEKKKPPESKARQLAVHAERHVSPHAEARPTLHISPARSPGASSEPTQASNSPAATSGNQPKLRAGRVNSQDF
jgi:hypothetical protein